MKREIRILVVLIGFLMWSIPVQALDNEDGKGVSGLPVPRFASLRSGEVNMRTGPGTRYPIEWVYNKQGLPVEIVAEFEIWRRVRDPDGSEGWVHKTEISGRRTAMVMGAPRDLLKSDNDQASVVAHLEMGAVGQLVSCSKDWCKLKFDDGIKGYLRKANLWGAMSSETFD